MTRSNCDKKVIEKGFGDVPQKSEKQKKTNLKVQRMKVKSKAQKQAPPGVKKEHLFALRVLIEETQQEILRCFDARQNIG